MTETADNSLLVSLLRDIRKEQNDQRASLLSAVDYMRKMEQRLDARIVAVRDDLELMLKSELMGRASPIWRRGSNSGCRALEPHD